METDTFAEQDSIGGSKMTVPVFRFWFKVKFDENTSQDHRKNASTNTYIFED